MRIGLPHELMHVEWIPNLKSKLSHLVPDSEWVHVPSFKRTGHLFSEGDACYPFKEMIRTSIALLSSVDVLLLPRIVGIDGFLMCPNFRALPDIVALNKERTGDNNSVPMVTPLMEVSGNEQLELLSRIAARDLLKISDCHTLREFSDETVEVDIPCDRDFSRSIALIGHPYVLADPTFNNGIPEMLRKNGFGTILAQEIPFKELDRLAGSRDYYAKKLYWRCARETLGAFLYFTQVRHPAGIIQLVPFNCGPDALLRIELMSLYKGMKDVPPYMVIVCDEHAQRDHVATRVEAFLDIVDGIKID
jgi:predicted nucleotide-binding protein (sugar kinase/HSP70/actin superfamily)